MGTGLRSQRVFRRRSSVITSPVCTERRGHRDQCGSLQAWWKGGLQRQGSWGVATNDREQGCSGTPGDSEVEEMRWPWDENDGLVRRKLLHRHISNHCLCLSLPAASAGPALHSCVHLPSSSRASSKRYWSLSFSRFWFPGLLPQ